MFHSNLLLFIVIDFRGTYPSIYTNLYAAYILFCKMADYCGIVSIVYEENVQKVNYNN